MKTLTKQLIISVLVLISIPLLVFGADDDGGSNTPCSIDGIVGLDPATDTSCFAIWVSVGEGLALNGIKWYNNDGSVIFPELLVQSGTADYPVYLDGSVSVGSNFSGSSSSWSEVQFTEPIACASSGFYVIFRVPEGSVNSGEGFGGGPAIGYTLSGEGFPGWISEDGEDWVQVQSDYGFAFEPIFIERTDGMTEKSFEGPDGQNENLFRSTQLHPAAPNPFNPSTMLKFSLESESQVTISIFNVKGERVKQLVTGTYSLGDHTVMWDGKNEQGRGVASGVYFARMATGSVAQTQRLVLVQ